MINHFLYWRWKYSRLEKSHHVPSIVSFVWSGVGLRLDFGRSDSGPKLGIIS